MNIVKMSTLCQLFKCHHVQKHILKQAISLAKHFQKSQFVSTFYMCIIFTDNSQEMIWYGSQIWEKLKKKKT